MSLGGKGGKGDTKKGKEKGKKGKKEKKGAGGEKEKTEEDIEKAIGEWVELRSKPKPVFKPEPIAVSCIERYAQLVRPRNNVRFCTRAC